MIEHILVGIDGSQDGQTALQYGLGLAGKFGASLDGLHVVDIVQAESPLLHDLAGSIAAAPFLNLTTHMRRNLELRGEQLLDQLKQACAEAGVSCTTHLVTGVVPTEIIQAAQDADLVLLGRGGLHTRLSKALLGSAVETVVRQGNRPTMVVPQNYRPLHKLLVATDGSPSALAALDTAAQFAQALALPLHVVHCTTQPDAGQSYLEEAHTRLTAAGVECHTDRCAGNAHDGLVRYMQRHDYDTLFMGAFGHRRLTEWIVGSTTQYLLRFCPGPLILCHTASTGTAT